MGLKSRYLLFAEELKREIRFIEANKDRCNDFLKSLERYKWKSKLDVYGVCAALFHLYRAFESYFLKVADFFDCGCYGHSERLIEQMVLEVPGVRPALIKDETILTRLRSLYRFHKYFLRMHRSGINKAKLLNQLDEIVSIYHDFNLDHIQFVEWIQAKSIEFDEAPLPEKKSKPRKPRLASA